MIGIIRESDIWEGILVSFDAAAWVEDEQLEEIKINQSDLLTGLNLPESWSKKLKIEEKWIDRNVPEKIFNKIKTIKPNILHDNGLLFISNTGVKEQKIDLLFEILNKKYNSKEEFEFTPTRIIKRNLQE